MYNNIAHRYVRKITAFVLRPLLAAVERNPQAELGAEEQQALRDRVLLDNVGIPAHAARGRDDGCPGLAEIRGFENKRSQVAEGVPVERRKGRALIETAGFHPRHPRSFRKAGNMAHYVRPRLTAIPRDLQVPIVGANPKQLDWK